MQAWIKEDEEEASTVIAIALHCKCGLGYTEESEDEDESQDEEQLQAYCKCGEHHEDEYIKFMAKFRTAMAGVSYWNNEKTNIIREHIYAILSESLLFFLIFMSFFHISRSLTS